MIFQQFFTPEVFETIASNINKYAPSKNVGQPQDRHQKRHPWKDTLASELMIWIGIIVYMLTVKLIRIEKYWIKNKK